MKYAWPESIWNFGFKIRLRIFPRIFHLASYFEDFAKETGTRLFPAVPSMSYSNTISGFRLDFIRSRLRGLFVHILIDMKGNIKTI